MVDDALIGKVVGRVRLPVEAGKIMEFASAVHDFNPLYRSAEAASARGFSGIPAPPTFAATVNHFPDEELRRRGGLLSVLGLDPQRVLGGEQSWTYLRTLHAGDQLTGEMLVKAISRKAGSRGGEMVFVTTETVFNDAQGEPVLIHSNTIIETAKTVGS